MAGKHVGGISNSVFAPPGSTLQLQLFRPVFPGTRVDKAFAQGRRASQLLGGPAPNPFPAGTAENRAWSNGALGSTEDNAGNIVQTGAFLNPELPN